MLVVFSIFPPLLIYSLANTLRPPNPHKATHNKLCLAFEFNIIISVIELTYDIFLLSPYPFTHTANTQCVVVLFIHMLALLLRAFTHILVQEVWTKKKLCLCLIKV